LKLTSPGVADIYQGGELWDFSLVDPDNRRPVDFDHRAQLLDRLERDKPRMHDLLKEWQDGSVKLFLTSRLLTLRAVKPDLFEKGEYEPLVATGAKSDMVCAFARRYVEDCVVSITTRFPARFESDPCWCDTTVPIPQAAVGRPLRNILTGNELMVNDGLLRVDAALEELPVATLVFPIDPS
jgi:(1->4)-alpha-D-glucan 1-alpha-D-glucosylmutase